MAIGAADVVPGVSGGTIAFISGIYEELLSTIDKLDLKFFSMARKEGWAKAWKAYNLSFLFTLGIGILLSIFTLARGVTYLMENDPIVLWSFFFGLVLASILYIGQQITGWNIKAIIALILAAVLAYFITIAVPSTAPDNYGFLFLSGFIAIIAMILPGISGSFILLLLGSYASVIGTVNMLSEAIVGGNLDLGLRAGGRLAVFAVGAVLGLKVFSKILTWMFDNYKNLTLAVLTGFMIGSLNKIWPWKEAISTYVNSEGLEVPLAEKSILPGNFAGDPQVGTAITACVVGFLIIFLLEKLANRRKGEV